MEYPMLTFDPDSDRPRCPACGVVLNLKPHGPLSPGRMFVAGICQHCAFIGRVDRGRLVTMTTQERERLRTHAVAIRAAHDRIVARLWG
jgi:hypothetical protein